MEFAQLHNLRLCAIRRLIIAGALVRAGEAGLSVGGPQEKLKIAPSTLPHDIKTLVNAGLINQVRQVATLTCQANNGN